MHPFPDIDRVFALALQHELQLGEIEGFITHETIFQLTTSRSPTERPFPPNKRLICTHENFKATRLKVLQKHGYSPWYKHKHRSAVGSANTVKKTGSTFIALLIYVDDLILTGAHLI